MKRMYKEKKKERKEQPQDGQKFNSMIIPRENLSLCRDTNYSKYIGDMCLTFVFGEKLGQKMC